jgi:hypothetical protein
VVSQRDYNAQLVEERIPIIDIWNAIETLRYQCTIGSVNIGNQWQVTVATENHVGKRYARSPLPSGEVSDPGTYIKHPASPPQRLRSILTKPPVPTSDKAVARAAGDGTPPPAYGAVTMMQIAIDVIGIAGIFYAQMMRNHPHLPATVTSAIPGYQVNSEDGVVRQLAQNLITQMDGNRQARGTLFAGPEPVTLQGVNGQWSLSARLEVSISHSSHFINIADLASL